MTDKGPFQRIADDEENEVTPIQRAREMEAARVRNFVDEVADESSRSLSFERISDDEAPEVASMEALAPATEAPINEPGEVEPATVEKRPARRAPSTTARKKKTGVIG